jgi:response regulator RpfG family c-di-GMP phosphodiesterase
MKKILLVDDEPGLLAVMRRVLQKHFSVETACGPIAGLESLKNWQEFSVVVSDMRMPDMNGIEFLMKVRELAPDIVRIMLTANVDQATAIQAVNKGNIFRFLNKPCSNEDLIDTLTASVRQHQLITAERDLLENTLRGSVKILTEILALADPIAFGQAQKVRDYMRELASALKVQDSWQFEVAALLSHIGTVTIPAELLSKSRQGQALTAEEEKIFGQVPAISGRLLSEISRFEEVSRILTYQSKHFDGSGEPAGKLTGTEIPLGARMLRFLCDLAELENDGKSRTTALTQLQTRTGWYDPHIVKAFNSANHHTAETASKPKLASPICFALLRIGHILRADVHIQDGTLIVASGNRVTPTLMERLRNFNMLSGIKEPVFVES